MGESSRMAPTFLTVALLVVATSAMAAVASKADVNIWNDIGDNEILQVKCASQDDHLGKHTLAYGDKFGWGFSPNLWGTTLFYCGFVWRNHWQSFVVWRSTFPAPCQHCEFRVGPDGFYAGYHRSSFCLGIEDSSPALEYLGVYAGSFVLTIHAA